jgi:hypothetical protein
MHHSKAQLIVAGGIGLFAIIGLAVSFLRPNGAPPNEAPSISEDRAVIRSYDEYARQLAEITPPADARTEEQLKAIDARLKAIEVPAADRQAWARTEAGQRHAQWLEDARALDEGVYSTRKQYRELAEAGQDVLRNIDAPELPRRARETLDRAGPLPNAQRDREKTIPGSQRITYGTVFEFPSVVNTMQTWTKVRGELEPLTLPRKP